MSKQHYIFLGLDDAIECLELSDGHGLILNEVEVDGVAVESVDGDEGKDVGFFIHEVDNPDGLLGIGHRVDLMIRKVFVVSRGSDHLHI